MHDPNSQAFVPALEAQSEALSVQPLADGPTAIEIAVDLQGSARDIDSIRRDLRTVLDQIFGACEMVCDRPSLPDPDMLVPVFEEISSVAQGIRAVLEASASAHANRSLRNFAERLFQLSGHVLTRAREVLKAVADGSDVELEIDVKQLETSSAALMTLAEELIRYHATSSVVQAAAQPAGALVQRGAGPAEPRDHQPKHTGLILIADDNAGNRRLLARRLEREGYSTVPAADGSEALKLLRVNKFDLVLLDINMPELDGMEALEQLKADPDLQDIPVIMISAVEDVSSVTTCIEKGADDYLPKPFDTAILKARVHSSVERKRLRDREKQQTVELKQALIDIERERQISDKLLLNILPSEVAEELRTRNSVEPMYFEDVTIVFTDFVGFTLSTENVDAEELVNTLHGYFTAFDNIIERHGLEKLKTIGDSYLYVGGLPTRTSSHPVDAILAAWEIIRFGEERAKSDAPISWAVRVGVHTGPVIAGVVGIHKFAFDIWGDSVNFASRMESSGAPNRINISERTHSRVKDFFACKHRGRQHTKDGREVDMYFVDSVSPRLMGEQGAAFARRYKNYFRKDPPDLPQELFT